MNHHSLLLALPFCLVAAAAPAKQEGFNLAAGKAVRIERNTDLSFDGRAYARLVDRRPRTVATLSFAPGAPFELVLELGKDVSTVERLSIQLAPGEDGKIPLADVELLASTVSPNAGFQSLRTNRLKPDGKVQSFAFPAAAARWVMLRLTPSTDAREIRVAEIAISGYRGEPRTRYAFRETPAKAFAVLAELKDTVDITVSADARSLFRDAADGRLDEWSFAEAALLVSGIEDRTKRKAYLARLARLEAEARRAVGSGGNAFDKGRLLLKWLHSDVMKKGYRAHQTDVSTVLDSGNFNCVSSAALYNILGRRLGLDLRAIEVPDHAFSILYDGTRHADVETTNPLGFNPARDPIVQEQFRKLTGFRYVPDRHRDRRREIGETGLLAVIYYNHGVELSRQKRYGEALLAYFHALSLDREFASAVKNVLASLTNWSKALADSAEYDKALVIVRVGLKLAPEDAGLRNNHKAIWHNWADTAIKAGKTDAALAIIRKAAVELPDGGFDKLEAWAFLQPAEDLIKQGKWREALEVGGSGLGKVSQAAMRDLRKWQENAYLRWSQARFKAGDFEAAARVLKDGLAAVEDGRRLVNNVAYVIQEWSWRIYKERGAPAAEALLAELMARYGDIEGVREVAEIYLSRLTRALSKAGKYREVVAAALRNETLVGSKETALRYARVAYDRWAGALAKARDWKAAIAIYEEALRAFPGDGHLLNNLKATWHRWAGGELKAKHWKKAAEIYGAALKAFPTDGKFRQNIAYIAQQWVLGDYAGKGAIVAEETLASLGAMLPEGTKLDRVTSLYMQTAVIGFLKLGKYDEAVAVIDRFRDRPHDRKFARSLTLRIFDTWSREHQRAGDFASAVKVYDQGLERLPGNPHLSHNAVVAWNSWAGIHIKKKEWPEAIRIYRDALKRFPNNGTLKNNLKYCQQQNGG